MGLFQPWQVHRPIVLLQQSARARECDNERVKGSLAGSRKEIGVGCGSLRLPPKVRTFSMKSLSRDPSGESGVDEK